MWPVVPTSATASPLIEMTGPGPLSSSRIVALPTAPSVPIEGLVGGVTIKEKLSVPSRARSPLTGTVTKATSCPTAKDKVPKAAA